MKQLKATYQTKTLNFRHWSRKGYAAFASLGKIVRIAVLRSLVSDRLSVKLNITNCFSLFVELFSKTDEEELDKTNDLSMLLEELFTVVCKPVVAGSEFNVNNKLNNICPADYGYFGLNCATDFGISVPPISVQTVPV